MLSVRERVYVKRARALGAGNGRLIFKHILPQVAPLLVANTVLLVAYAIFAETFITFLGLGDPSVISWGRLIENAFNDDAILNNAWWAIIPPGLCVTLVVLGATLFGQSLEDALNPRLRVGHLSVRRFKVRPCAGSSTPNDDAAPRTRGLERLVRASGRRRAARGARGELRARGGRALRARRRVRLKTTAMLSIMGLLPPPMRRSREKCVSTGRTSLPGRGDR